MMVSYRDIYFDCEALEDIAAKLKDKIEEINHCYYEIKVRIKELYGINDTWKGKDKEKYYHALEIITKKYEGNIKKLLEIYLFLRKTIDNYRSRDKQFEKDLADNSDNFDM